MSAANQLGLSFGPPQRRVWSVRELVAAVRTHIEREFADIWVEGEISNFRPAESGHLYFTLKDNGAQLRIVMFRSQARLLRFKPENGMKVVARGRVTVYEDRGELQILAEYLEPKGAGALQVAFEQLKQKLAAEGLFDAGRKKPLPQLPRRIGVVTSPRGAAIQDILNIIRRRHSGVDLLIYPAQVQGNAAPHEVGAGVKYFNRANNVEVIIVARGGGSLEDLAAFNDEGLARTVAGSQLPVVSAVGHETDFTICDFVADLRAPTPSAAAELVVRSRRDVQDQVEGLRQRLARGVRFELLTARNAYTELMQHRAFGRTMDVIRRRQQRVDELTFRLGGSIRTMLGQWRQQLDAATARLHFRDVRKNLADTRRIVDAQAGVLASTVRGALLQRRNQVERLTEQLQALSPLAILDRGYALIFDANGNLLKDAGRVASGDEIRARLSRGEITAKVRETH